MRMSTLYGTQEQVRYIFYLLKALAAYYSSNTDVHVDIETFHYTQ